VVVAGNTILLARKSIDNVNCRSVNIYIIVVCKSVDIRLICVNPRSILFQIFQGNHSSERIKRIPRVLLLSRCKYRMLFGVVSKICVLMFSAVNKKALFCLLQ